MQPVQPEVSVILPTCDRPALVGRALESVLQQTFANLEVLLVDNNRRSPRVSDNSALADPLRDPRVRLIEASGAKNAAMARNAGLDRARGTWITFLDDDDTYRSDKIAVQHALARATGAPLVLCGLELVWPHHRRGRQLDRERFYGDEILTHTTLGAATLFHLRTDAVRFDGRFAAGEDMLYALRIILKYAMTELPCVAQPLVFVPQRSDNRGVHSNKEAVWRAYRAASFVARGQFSRTARRDFLAKGRVERALGGYGGASYFLGSLRGVLRSRLPHKWRFALFAINARLRSGA
jgi:hypothetical protein